MKSSYLCTKSLADRRSVEHKIVAKGVKQFAQYAGIQLRRRVEKH